MDPQLKTKNIPTVFIIFGATGDLMGKKIVPALFYLYKKGKFPKLFKIIGFSRRNLTEPEFVHFVRETLMTHTKGTSQEDAEKFLSYFLYQKGDFDELSYYKKLASRMGIIDGQWSVCSNKLFYLAVPPQYYKNIFERLAKSGLTIPCGPDEGWTRVIVEKPFGHDLKTAEELDELLGKLFKEEQIYRIDHYLAKEMLQNILAFRFANNLFEDIWNSKYIEKIEIRTNETLGAEGRGTFYDGIGALRDVGQNHLLQMLALVTMERPSALDAEHVRIRRGEVLQTLEALSPEEIKNQTFRAQYKGFQDIKGVRPNSTTETYFKVMAKLTHPRWKGVKITLEAGKRLPLKKEIVITFKHPTPCLCPAGQPHFQNKITFGLEPKEGITVEFWSKKPGLDYKYVKRNLNFVNRRVTERVQYVEEYERLLLDCVSGNQILFLTTPEVVATWKYIDPIIRAWEKDLVPLGHYKPDSKEPIVEAARKIDQIASNRFKKEIGIIGLGKMGGNAALQLTSKDWKVVGYNRTYSVTQGFSKQGIIPAKDIRELIEKLSKPRVVWLMLPAGQAVDETIFGPEGLARYLSKGDIIIDAGNSFYKDAKTRAEKLKKYGINFVDVGFSGGPEGARYGACLMVGGSAELFEYLYPLYQDLAGPEGVAHFEGVGAGHFVKMVHNGIEYGMMQSIAEGFSILKKSTFELDLKEVVHVYNHGSVVESRLTKWLEDAFAEYGMDLNKLSGAVGHTGEGEWTAKIAKELGIDAKIIGESFQFRVESMEKPSYAGKVLTAMRNQFGGHSTEHGKMT